jgi:hypothetical protein
MTTPAVTEDQAAFQQALAADAQVSVPEVAGPPRRDKPSDPDAPHGRDAGGKPLAPHGLNRKTGRPNLKPGGPGRPAKGDESAKSRTREATAADVPPAKGGAKKAELEPQDYAGPLMEASEAIWFGGSMIAKIGPQVPLLGRFVPGRKLGATCAIFDSERPRLCAALNLAARHDQRARNLAAKLAAGEVSWALTCMFMVAPFTGAVAAVWQTSDEHNVLAERELPDMAVLVKRNDDALDAMLARISGQMEAAQLAMAQAQAEAMASQNGQGGHDGVQAA